jgi:hypothetical protein
MAGPMIDWDNCDIPAAKRDWERLRPSSADESQQGGTEWRDGRESNPQLLA